MIKTQGDSMTRRTVTLVLFAVLLVGSIVGAASHFATKSSRSSEMLYLHVYSDRYNIYTMSSRLAAPPRPWQCIATIGVMPGSQFFANLPNHYEPEMEFYGVISKKGDTIETDFVILLADPGGAIEHKQTAPVALETFVPCWNDEFCFNITQSREPPPCQTTRTLHHKPSASP